MKSYVTPMLSFESFELSSNTAGNCGVRIDTQSSGTCGIDEPGVGQIFLDGMNFCLVPVDDKRPVCYHNPEGSNLFNS